MSTSTAKKAPPLKAIIGAGRSGSTWLGSIINSHPEVAYRFEPFHRLQRREPKFKYLLDVLADPNISDQNLEEIYLNLFKADPLTEKPPFFEKKYVNQFGIKNAWMFARTFRPAKYLYRSLYTPKEYVPLVFKEVTYEKFMKNLLTNTSMPITYLVRHPCANVMSDVKGQQEGKMPSRRQDFLERLLKEHDLALYEQYAPQLDHMSRVEKVALLWRIDLEKGIAAIQTTGKGLLISYEQLCDDPHKVAKRVFDYFELKFEPQTKEFLDRLCAVDGTAIDSTRKKDMMDSFFTVYRNPKQQKDAWKSKISPDDRQAIENIVSSSAAFQYCASISGWD
jgi:hypothetical protein